MSGGVARPVLDWATANDVAKVHGDSFFVLDDGLFRANFEKLLSAFGAHYHDVRIGYSYKTNYTPRLCRIIHELGGYAEVVSEMEYDLAMRLGVPGPRIIFNGPYKSARAFRDAALAGALINLDSLRDLALLTEVAAANAGTRFGVAIRCNFGLDTQEISRFGFDVQGQDFKSALAAVSQHSNLYLKGLHCHFPDRDLASFATRSRKMAALANAIFPEAPPELLNIGGGYASNMPESLRKSLATAPATFGEYGRVVGKTLTEAFGGRGRLPVLFLEPGTALVADTLRYYTKIISIKKIRGHNFATTAGSLFDISASARFSNLPVTAICRSQGQPNGEVFDVVGYTCVEKDVLSRQLAAPLAVDDFLCFENVGSYSIVMKPPFILPASPILAWRGDAFEVVRERETMEDIFRNFKF